MVFDVECADNRQNTDDEVLETRELPAPKGILGAREGRQHPTAGNPPGTLVQITCGWAASKTPLIAFFFLY